MSVQISNSIDVIGKVRAVYKCLYIYIEINNV